MAAEPGATSRDVWLQRYADGLVTWRDLQWQGFDNYVEVLGGLGELGLRPPLAPMSGPNVAARERGRAMLRRALTPHPGDRLARQLRSGAGPDPGDR